MNKKYDYNGQPTPFHRQIKTKQNLVSHSVDKASLQ